MGGQEWGKMDHVNRQVTYGVSPYEQNIFKGFIKKGIPRTVQRIRGSLWNVIPFVLAYGVYEWGNAEYVRLQRKNPADYADDK